MKTFTIMLSLFLGSDAWRPLLVSDCSETACHSVASMDEGQTRVEVKLNSEDIRCPEFAVRLLLGLSINCIFGEEDHPHQSLVRHTRFHTDSCAIVPGSLLYPTKDRCAQKESYIRSLVKPHSWLKDRVSKPLPQVFMNDAEMEAMVCADYGCIRIEAHPGECLDDVPEYSASDNERRASAFVRKDVFAFYSFAQKCRLEHARSRGMSCEKARKELNKSLWFSSSFELNYDGDGLGWCEVHVGLLLREIETIEGLRCAGWIGWDD